MPHSKIPLQNSENLFQSIVENSHSGIFIVDEKFIFIYANEKLCNIMGYEASEIIGKDFRKFLQYQSLKIVESNYVKIMKGEDAPSVYEFNIVRKQGDIRHLEIASIVIKTLSGSLNIIGQVIDITDRKKAEKALKESEKQFRLLAENINNVITPQKKLEEQLRRAQKMEAAGNLAGGIAHDFNNTLQTIFGYTQLMLMKKQPHDPDRKYLEIIENSIHKSGELTRRILLFSSKIESDFQPVCLNNELGQITQILERTFPKMISINLVPARDLNHIKADPVQLEQVIMNLALNARDSMPEGGELKIKTENAFLTTEYCKKHPGTKPGEYVLLTVSDTGHGMSSEVQDRIFEPFFTTKESGKGTGLGLSMVYGIIKSHSGYISCKSRVGKGTDFKIYFPILDAETRKKNKPQDDKKIKISDGKETILLVDDDKNILESLEDILVWFGYMVITAENGKKALETYEQLSNNIDLIILDLNMPGISGQACLKRVRMINPGAKVIVATGYSGREQIMEIIKPAPSAFVFKPFQFKDLLNTVRDILDKNAQ